MRPTVPAVIGNGEPTCLVKSGSLPARRKFFSEAEADRRARSPGLPHQRHTPLTVDELLAAIILVIGCGIAVIYAIGSLV